MTSINPFARFGLGLRRTHYADFVSGDFWLAQDTGGVWSSTPVGRISAAR